MAALMKILVDKGEVKQLADLFKVTEQTIRNALRFITEGEDPDRYRAEAIKRGGAIISRKVPVPRKKIK